MKYNMEEELVGFDGKPITEGEDDSPVTLGKVLMMACVNANPQEHKTGEDKLKIYRLLQTVHAGGDVELTAEEVALLKELVGVIYGVGMVGAVYDCLEKERPTKD